MSYRALPLIITLALVGALGACGDDAPGPSDAGPGAPPAGPGPAAPTSQGEMTKAQMIKDLRTMFGNLEAGALDELVSYFVMPPGMTPEDAKEPLSKSIKRELEIEGIDVMEAEAKFGKLTELYPERGAGWAERMGVNPEECYALKHAGGEVAAHWNGSAFKYIRVDDIGPHK